MYNAQQFHDILIIGAGLSGLSTAHFLSKMAPDLKILLVEKSDRVGGVIKSHCANGYLAEHGPHGYLNNVEESRELLADLKLEESTQEASLNQFIRYLCLGGKLNPIPQHPLKIITSDILPLSKKLRVLADLWKSVDQNEQTVADWVQHRFGSALLPFADAVLTGIYAGDIKKLSLDAVFPGIRQLERRFGSVIRAAIKSRKKGKIKGLPSMLSFTNGMEELVIKLAEDKTIQFNKGISAIEYASKKWTIQAEDSQTFRANKIIIATNINHGLRLLSQLAPPPVNKVPEAHLANIVMGFKSNKVKIPHGFGYLAPQKEKRFSLGTLFSTRMFPNRAPKDREMIEVLVGGRHHPDRLQLDDDELINQAYDDVSQLIELNEFPIYTKVIRTKTGFPQLELGHLKLQAYKDQTESRFDGLFITGFGWMGIGVNDMIKSSKSTASRLISGDSGLAGIAKAKGIYF